MCNAIMVSYNDRCRGGDAGDKIVYLNEAFAGIAQTGVLCCNSYDFRTSRIGKIVSDNDDRCR